MTIHELFQRGLNLEKLRSFLEVAQVGSVTKAAGGEGSRRSLMSRQIGELEATLGFDLFRRNGRTIEITERGRELALLTAAFFAEFENVATRGNKADARIKIGAGASVFEALIFPRLRRLEQVFPQSRFDFCGFATNDLVRALHGGQVDLGVVRSGLNHPGLTEIPAGKMDFVLAGRRDFDTKLGGWSARKFLSSVPIATIRGSGHWIASLKRLCSELDVELHISHQAETFGHMRELLKAGAPGAILPTALAEDLPESDFVIIKDEALRTLDRPLSVVFESRAGKVRDRLELMATDLAEVL